jgi:hypothetical protein
MMMMMMMMMMMILTTRKQPAKTLQFQGIVSNLEFQTQANFEQSMSKELFIHERYSGRG